MTTTATTETVTSAEPAYRVFDVTVCRVQQLSPSFVRITFTGPDAAAFGTDGLDQRIKLVLPNEAGHRPDAADFEGDSWYAAWRELPDELRCPLRTYTVRAVRPHVGLGEIDIDLVVHVSEDGHDGPAARWLKTAEVGTPCVLIGPNARYDGPPSGIEWAPPASASTLLLAGDETAAPAICSILESLPLGTQAHAFVEVPLEGDALPLDLAEGVSITWLPRSRGGATPVEHGSLLDRAVRSHMQLCAAKQAAGLCDMSCHEVPIERITLPARPAAAELDDVDVDQNILWEVPTVEDASRPLTDCYAWIAGEAGVIKLLRRHLVSDLGIDRRSVAFMGYWRRGKAEG